MNLLRDVMMERYICVTLYNGYRSLDGTIGGQNCRRSCCESVRIQEMNKSSEGATAVQVNMGVFSVQSGEGRCVLNMLLAVCILSSLLKPAG